MPIVLQYFQSDRCSGDRLQVSRAGNSNLSDSERYCSGPFTVKSFSNRLVIGKLPIYFLANMLTLKLNTYHFSSIVTTAELGWFLSL